MADWKVRLIAYVFIIILSYFTTAGILWVVCLAFGFAWSWKVTFAVWLVEALLRSIFSRRG